MSASTPQIIISITKLQTSIKTQKKKHDETTYQILLEKLYIAILCNYNKI